MKHGLGMSFALLLCATAEAADPPPPASDQKAALPKPAVAKPPDRQSLNLRIGDVRKYMTPQDYLAALERPDEDKTTVVVQGARDPSFRLESEKPIPFGFPPATLWWALRHPANSWRILTPDVNTPEAEPTFDKIPPPIFRWGP